MTRATPAPTVGGLGLLGLGLPGLARRRPETNREGAGQVRHLPAPVRRAQPHRHVRHEARRPRRDPRRVQADRDQRRRASRSASSCRAWPSVMDKVTLVRSVHAHDEEPQLGRLLQPDRPRPAARRHRLRDSPRPVPGLRLASWIASPRPPAACRPSSSYPARHPRRLDHARPARQLPRARRTTRCFISQDPNAADFRLPELSLPAEPVARAAGEPPRSAAS